VRQPLYEVSRLSKPDPLSGWQLAREAALVSGAAIAAVLLVRSGARLVSIEPAEASSGLAVLAGALALATASMWHVLRWLTGDGRASLGSGAMALYALVAVPTTALGTVINAPGGMDLGRLTTHAVVVVLLVASSMESMSTLRPGNRKLLAAGLLVVLGSVAYGFIEPESALALSQVPTLRWLVAAGWVLAGVRVTRVAVRNGLTPSMRVGLGLALLAVAHCYLIAAENRPSDGSQGLTFATLRLVALGFIGWGALQFGRRALQKIHDEVRPRQPKPLPAGDALDIGPVVHETTVRYRTAGLDVHCDVAPGLVAGVTPEILTQILAQLLTNCAQHASGSPVTIMAWDAGDRVVLRVCDKGPGVPDEVQPTMFDRGIGGSEPGGPHRGLSTCRELLTALGGEIRLYRGGTSGDGCTIQIELPAAAHPGSRLAPVTDETRFSAFANEQAGRAARAFGEATQAARRVAVIASQPPSARGLESLPRLGLGLALLVATVAVSRVPFVMNWLVTREVGISLALVAVAGGALSAFACGVLGQLGDEPAGLWLCAGLAFYSVIGIPVAAYNANTPDAEAAVSNVRLVANAMFIALTLTAVFAAKRPSRDGWSVLAIGLLAALSAAALGVAYPAESLDVSTNPGVRFALSAFWLASGVVLIATGGTRRTPWMYWAGIGCTIIAIAHTQRAAAGSPYIPLGSTFTSVRLLGVLIVAAAVLPAARHVLVETYAARHRQLAELREAKTDIQRFAERDHDIRGGLAVLANANVLLESRIRPQAEQDVLRSAVNAELKRLNELLKPPDADDGGDPSYEYEIVDVLEERITLQTGPDSDVRMDIEPNLWAYGNPLVLSQVLANVLTNWQRHAPGSPLRIQAMHHGENVVLRICDFGPGIPADIANRVFDLAVRGPASPGQGFGLHICRRLLEGESGQIHIQRRQGRGTGCTVVIELPAATGDGSARELTDRSAS